MAKINQEEYKLLKGLDEVWKWIARESDGDYGGDLFVYSEKPLKKRDIGRWNYGGWFHSIDNHLFQFIQWEDEKPHNITELIKEYEFGKILLAMAEEETVLELEYESEEKEVKILESDYVVIEKPAIPQFVADYIEKCKGWNDDEEFYDEDNAIDLFGAMHPDNAGMSNKVHDYLVDNQETFARAWLDGFTMEEEQKYIVRLNRGVYKPVFIALDKISNHIHHVESHDYNKESLRVHLNEWEIRALDNGDVLFEHFAVKAEELEENGKD